MWTQGDRARCDRSKPRCPGGLTGEERATIGPPIPPAKPGANKRRVDARAAVNGVVRILSTGCQWAALPKDPPPRSAANDHPRRWDQDRTLGRIHRALHVLCRGQAGREAGPTAAIIGSRSVKGAEKEGAASTGRALTRARRPRARSATSWSTPKAR